MIKNYKRYFEHNSINEFIEKHTLEQICDILNITLYNKDHVSFVVQCYIDKTIKNSMLKNYCKELGDKFTPSQFLIYKEFRSHHTTDSGSQEYFKSKYGEHWESFKQKANKTKTNPYKLEDVCRKHNLDKVQGEAFIQELKSKTRGTLDNFVSRHGKKVGGKKFLEFCEKSKHTLDTFRNKYGAEAETKYRQYLKSKDSMSVSFCKKKYGDHWKEGRVARINAVKITYDKFLTKYGDEKLAQMEYKKYIDRKTKHIHRFREATKESRIFFEPILKKLEKLQISFKFDKSEYFIWDQEKCRRFYYDLTIPKLKIIVEFNGHSHPDPNLEDSLKVSWRCPYRGISYESATLFDEYKKQLAINKGFKYLDVFWKDNLKTKQRSVLKLIEETHEN